MKKPPATEAADFALEWEFLGNQFHTGYSSAVFTLINKSKHHLGNSGWEIYFSQMGRGVIPESVTAPVQIQHVNGDLVVIRPDLEFSLDPGEKVVIAYNKPGKVLKENEAPLGPYMVFHDSSGEVISAQAFEDYTIKTFPGLMKVFPEGSGIPLPDAAWIFQQNQHNAFLSEEEIGHILPSPARLYNYGQTLTLEQGWRIQYEEGLEREAEYLAGMLEDLMGFAPELTGGVSANKNGISLHMAETGRLEKEGYLLDVQAGSGVQIEAAGQVFFTGYRAC
jgi:hypothetical protein